MNENCVSDGDEVEVYSFCAEGGISCIKFRANTVTSIPIHRIDKYSTLNLVGCTTAKKKGLTLAMKPTRKYLSLPNNNLKKINAELFTAFPQLTWLDVRDNRIQEFPRVVGHKCLETILLAGNKIERLPIELGSFKELSCVQVKGNPLVFPEAEVLEKLELDLVSFLKQCWAHQSERPHIKVKCTDKEKRKKGQVKKDERLLRVKNLGNIASVITEKMKSRDPVDQLLASHVIKKMRAIDKQLQKTKDEELVKCWREKHRCGVAVPLVAERVPPYDTDSRYMTMLNRQDLATNISKESPKRSVKKPINLNEELLKLDSELGVVRRREVLTDPALEKAHRLTDIHKMNEILKKIKDLELLNSTN